MPAFDSVFSAVFPPASDVSIPTPSVTPVLGSSGFGESFGPPLSPEVTPVTGVTEQIKWDRAWHTATTFLSLPHEQITAVDAGQTKEIPRGKWFKPYTREVSRAVEYVVSEDSYGRQLRKQLGKEDLLRWYFEEMGVQHYIECVRPGLIQALNHERRSTSALVEVGEILTFAQAIYLHPLKNHVLQLLPNGGEAELSRIKSDFHGIFTYSLAREGFTQHLRNFLKEQASMILGVGEAVTHQISTVQAERQTLKRFIQALNDVGLGGAKAQRVFAEVMSDILTNHVQAAYAGRWASPSSISEELRDWVENHFARFAVEILDCLKEDTPSSGDQLTTVTLADVERWQEMGISILGALRTSELFDIIVDWDNGSLGAIEDLKRYVTKTSSRAHLTTSFSNDLSRRLLQPGASTLEILQIYTSLIRAFTVLDPKGVLLDRLGQPIRRYLRERDDTVKIVVGGLLADPHDELGDFDHGIDLMAEMKKAVGQVGEDEMDDGELDWNDMSWMPNPIDAGPGFKKSRNSDVIGSLISLFDSKDIFVKEFQNILGERLLKREQEFDKEVRVLELLKLRFGEPALQTCEVMLRDILDSRRVDARIRHDKKLISGNDLEPSPDLQARILSHLFWPSLHSESFSIPPEVESLQSLYSKGFENLKQSRKLTWLHALGQVTVKLSLEDREITEVVQTWQASVIYAFQTPDTSQSQPLTKSVHELMDELSMSESLVRNALTFWTAKLVLKETSASTYSVLETLSAADAAAEADLGGDEAAQSAIAAETAAAAPAVVAEDPASSESMALFWQYSLAMLTNQGPMPLQQIVAYLGVFVPGGFPFGNETMKEFLDGKVKEGRLDFVGGNYKIVA